MRVSHRQLVLGAGKAHGNACLPDKEGTGRKRFDDALKRVNVADRNIALIVSDLAEGQRAGKVAARSRNVCTDVLCSHPERARHGT